MHVDVRGVQGSFFVWTAVGAKHPSGIADKCDPLSFGTEVYTMMKTFPLSQFTLVAVISLFVLTAATSALAQEQQEQEDSRAIRTREFLGLGRMPDRQNGR